MSRRACASGIATVLALACATAAQGAVEIAPGAAQPSNLLGGCGPDGQPTCAYVIAGWDQTKGTVAATSLPFTSAGVITRFRAPFHRGGSVRLRIIRKRPGDPHGSYDVRASSPSFAVTAGGLLDVPVRLPVAPGDTLGMSLAGGAGPYVVYEQGGGGPGAGLLLIAADGDAQLVDVFGIGGGDPDALSLAVTLEPDADGDGLGDETQEAAPPPPASPPALLRARLRGRTLHYVLTQPAHVRARLQRRAGRTRRVLRLPGAAGANRVKLPRWARRVVLRAESPTGARRIVLRRA